MLDFLQSSQLTAFLAVLLPTAVFAAVNIKFFTGRQAINAVLIIAVLGALVGGLFRLLNDWVGGWPITAHLQSGFHFFLPNFLSLLILAAVFFILNERFFTETLFAKAAAGAGRAVRGKRKVLLVAAGIIAISSFTSLLPLNILLLLWLFSTIFDAKKHNKEPKEMIFANTAAMISTAAHKQAAKSSSVLLANKPNIYILFLESYCSPRARKKIFKREDKKTRKIMETYGLKYYDNIFSNAQTTMSSAAIFFDCRLNQATNIKPIAAGAFAPNVLKSNGYSFEIFDQSCYTMHRIFKTILTAEDYTSFTMSSRAIKMYEIAGPLFAQSKYLRRFTGCLDPFDVDINFNRLFELFKQRLALAVDHPRLFYMRFGATHASSNSKWRRGLQLRFVRRYERRFKEAQDQLDKTLKLITEQDPDALVVALGDHGPRCNETIFSPVLGGAEQATEPEEILKELGVSMETLALDFFSVPLGIRWPVPHKTDDAVISHVNIFKYIFEALGGGEELLQTLQPNISITIHKPSIIVREGCILERPEPFVNGGARAV